MLCTEKVVKRYRHRHILYVHAYKLKHLDPVLSSIFFHLMHFQQYEIYELNCCAESGQPHPCWKSLWDGKAQLKSSAFLKRTRIKNNYTNVTNEWISSLYNLMHTFICVTHIMYLVKLCGGLCLKRPVTQRFVGNYLASMLPIPFCQHYSDTTYYGNYWCSYILA